MREYSLESFLSLPSDFNKLEPTQKCTTYDLVAVITHHGSVGGKTTETYLFSSSLNIIKILAVKNKINIM